MLTVYQDMIVMNSSMEEPPKLIINQDYKIEILLTY